jgi:hypothetical protein
MIRLKNILLEQEIDPEIRQGAIDFIKNQTKDVVDWSGKDGLQNKELPKTYINREGDKISFLTEENDYKLFMIWYNMNMAAKGTDPYAFEMVMKLKPPLGDSKDNPIRTAFWKLAETEAGRDFLYDITNQKSFLSYYNNNVYDQGSGNVVPKRDKDDKDEDDSILGCNDEERNWLQDYACAITGQDGLGMTALSWAITISAILGYHGTGYLKGNAKAIRVLSLGFTRRELVKIWGWAQRKIFGGNNGMSAWIKSEPGLMRAHYLNMRKLGQAGTLERFTKGALEQGKTHATGVAKTTPQQKRALNALFNSPRLFQALQEDMLVALETMVARNQIGSSGLIQMINNNRSNVEAAGRNPDKLINNLDAETWRKYGGRTVDRGDQLLVIQPKSLRDGSLMKFSEEEIKSGVLQNPAQKGFRWGTPVPITSLSKSTRGFAKKIGADRNPDIVTTKIASGLKSTKFYMTRSQFNNIVKKENLFAGKNMNDIYNKIDNAFRKGIPSSPDYLRGFKAGDVTKQDFIRQKRDIYNRRGQTYPGDAKVGDLYDMYKLASLL